MSSVLQKNARVVPFAKILALGRDVSNPTRLHENMLKSAAIVLGVVFSLPLFGIEDCYYLEVPKERREKMAKAKVPDSIFSPTNLLCVSEAIGKPTINLRITTERPKETLVQFSELVLNEGKMEGEKFRYSYSPKAFNLSEMALIIEGKNQSKGFTEGLLTLGGLVYEFNGANSNLVEGD